jgi:hypothetical protein
VVSKLVTLFAILLLIPRIASATVAKCTITGQVVNADGSPDANDTITINPSPTTQTINNTIVTAQPVSVQTDANGNLTAFALVQNLNVYVTFHNSTAAPIVTFVPNTTNATFAQFLSGTLINGIPTANGGLSVTGSIVDHQIGTPTAPAVLVNVTGSTSYTYFCVANDFNLDTTIPSSGTTVTTAASTPNNIVTCGGQTGALSYSVLKTNTSTLLGTCVTLSGTACSVTDVGQSTSAYVPSTTDATGSLYFDNNSPIFEKTSGGTYANLFYLDASNVLQIGGTGVASINFANPTNISSTFTNLTVTNLLTVTGLVADAGGIDIFGSSSGRVHLDVPAAAGTTTFTLPSTNGTAGQILKTDGSGNTSWGGGGFWFGGSYLIGTVTAGFAGIMHTTRALTVDNCYAAWPSVGTCSTFPQIRIQDIGPGTIADICHVTTDNSGSNNSNVSLTTSTVPSGDTLLVSLLAAPVGCGANGVTISIGMVYH